MSKIHRLQQLRPARRTRTALAGSLAVALTGALTVVGGPAGAAAPATTPIESGGSIVIGADQEPACADWLSTCTGSIWGDWLMRRPTIPVTFDIRRDGEHWVPVPSDLLTAEPTVETADEGMTITYSINPDAVWSDGTPITSADFAYTALAIRDGDDIFDKTGYDMIVDVETPEPGTAVVHLDRTYAGWRTLFSNAYGVLPAHLLEGEDRTEMMRDGYSFSGGPWIIESWERGTSVTLVRNENYWGDQAHLDQVTFLFIPDTAASFQALKSGQVDALYPTPQLDAMSQISAGLPGINSQIDPQSGNLEALWINNDAFPFDSTAVRQAFAHSLDRDAIVARIYGEVGVETPAQSFFTPLLSSYATDAFAQYQRDLDEVTALMEGDGWAKDDDGFWALDGQRASFAVHTIAGNQRRALLLQIIQQQAAEAGFEVTIEPATPSDLFAQIAPSGDFQVGLWTLVDYFPDPALTVSFHSGNIPNEANDNSGINFQRVAVDGLDPVLDAMDTELDDERRVELAHEADTLLADDAASLPIVAIPNILLTSEQIVGPVEINPGEGPFWNLAEWGLAG